VADQPDNSARLFVEAVAAELRRDQATATARYTALTTRHPDDIAAIIELAAYDDRQLRNDDAIAGYHLALALDSHLVRPHFELCRLYNRTSEAAQARDHAQRALAAYQAAGDRAGEAQARLCITDTLRVGSKAEREEAGRSAALALAIFEDLRMPYNTARARHYAAMAAEAQGHLRDAAAAWELSLVAARAVGNVPLQTAVLTNLGTTYKNLGDRGRAVDFYEQSYKLNEALGNDQGAAYARPPPEALLIEHGDPDAGLRDVQNALTVVRKIGDRNFEVIACRSLLHMIAPMATSSRQHEN
jgi:tetratricopeptide (TPR) repeat protein